MKTSTTSSEQAKSIYSVEVNKEKKKRKSFHQLKPVVNETVKRTLNGQSRRLYEEEKTKTNVLRISPS